MLTKNDYHGKRRREREEENEDNANNNITNDIQKKFKYYIVLV